MVPFLRSRAGPSASARLPPRGVVHASSVPRAAAVAARARRCGCLGRAVRCLVAMVTVSALRVIAGADIRGIRAARGRARAGAGAAAGRARAGGDGAQQEGLPRAPRALALHARRRRPDRVARPRLPRGGRPATGGRVRRARTRAGDSRRSRAGRGRLAEQHGVPRRLPRRSSRHYLVLAGH